MPLDDIVNSRQRSRGRRTDDSSRGRNRRTDSSNAPSYEAALKFLLDNDLAGVLIGMGGSSIREMIDVTGASIHISSSARRHPTTMDRTLFISGDADSVRLGAALVWEMIGQQTDARNNGRSNIAWDPNDTSAKPGRFDHVDVHCQVIVPAAAAGRILGRGGNVFRTMESESDVQASMEQAADGELLQERIISLSGTVAGCMKFTALLLDKLLEEEGGCQFVYSGSAYPQTLGNAVEPAPARSDNRRGRTPGNGNGNGSSSVGRKRSYSPADDHSMSVGGRRVSSRGGTSLA
jgi:hypothetical protein